MNIVDRPSPNKGARPTGVTPDMVIIHGTAGKSDAGDVDWCTRAEAKVSYHYIIGRDGTIYRLVDEDERAWHAGVSEWEGRSNCNDYSIGIGFSNDGEQPFTHAQYVAGGCLLADITRRRKLASSRIVGHCQVSPGRKTDPWLHFWWSKLLGCMWAALEAPPERVVWVDGKRIP